MKSLKILLIVVLLLTVKIIFIFAYSSDPKEFISELVKDAINTLANKNLNEDEKSKFIEKVALDNVDINALGLYTLGELRKSAEKKDIDAYKSAFEKIFSKKSYFEINGLFIK